MSSTAFQRLRREEQEAKKADATKLPSELAELTNKELKALLDEKGIEYDAKATKAELIKLLEGPE